ncbi:hypothetical protein [Chryseobacterium sp. Mn2064]|uniref:hypothetical protein n=1 Tax=Chryseobacterium sp. Mn2064 TaxID=3395263 RepID=UPI003BDB2321
MTTQEFEKIIDNFDPEKDDLKDKVEELFDKGANIVDIFRFIIKVRDCGLRDAYDLAESCPSYHKRYNIQ